MSNKRNLAGVLLLAVLMGVTGFVLLRDQPLGSLVEILHRVDGRYVLLGLGLMLVFVGSEAMCTRLILGRLGHRTPYRRCLCYSFVGFYVSSITPSATGGQPAQIYYMSRDGVPAAHGALNMMLIAICYQITVLLYALCAWLFLPALRQGMGGGLGLLLLYGAAVMGALTAGMLSFLCFPHLAGRLAGGVLDLLNRVHIIRDRAGAGEKLARQMEEYAAGAGVLRRNPALLPMLLGLNALQLTAVFSVPYVVYRAFGLSGTGPALFLGTQALVTLAVSSLPLPGAVGPAEGGFVVAFAPIFGAGLVTPAMLVSRGISFYAFLIISGAVALAFHLMGRKAGTERSLLHSDRKYGTMSTT